MSSDILIFGTGGHAKVVFDAAVQQQKWNPIAFVSLEENMQSFMSLKHYSQKDLVSVGCNKGVIAIGDNHIREKVVEYVLSVKPDFEFVSIVHPKANVSGLAKLSEGSVVFAGASVNVHAQLGKHTIVNTNASVDHDTLIQDYSSVAPGAVLGGNVKVGRKSAIGLGAKVIHGIQIGDNTVIGAGSLVLKDVESFKVAYGSPCSVVRSRQESDPYL